MKRAVLENLCLSAVLVGLCIFFELRHNREALLMALGAMLALWKHSGRHRKEDGAPPKGAAPGTVGEAALPAVLALLALASGCQADGRFTAELSLRVHRAATSTTAESPVLASAEQALKTWQRRVDNHIRYVITRRAAQHAPLATAITPITNLSGGASGMPYAGESYQVACTVSGSVTLYPAVYDAAAAAWEVYQGYPCALSDAVVAEGACIFPARTGSGLTWNAFKTGAGSVSACTAAGRQGPVPAGRAVSGGGGGGTVTDVTATAPLASSGGTTPDISLAGLVGQDHGGTGADLSSSAINLVWATPPTGAAGPMTLRKVVSADITAVVTAGSCTSCSLSYNAQGQVTAAASGSAAVTVADLFVSPISLGTGVGWSLIAGDYVWGTGWTALKNTTIVNVRAYTAETSGTLYLKLWVGGVAVGSGTVAVTAAGVYTLATPFSYTVPAGTTFTVSAYADVGVAGIPSFVNSYTNTSYPVLGSPTLMMANPRLFGSGNVEPTSTSSNFIFGVEPVVGS